jgi:hypothetical protein
MRPSHGLANYRWFSVGLIVPSGLLGAAVDLLTGMVVVFRWMMLRRLGAVVDLLVGMAVVVRWMMPRDRLGAVVDLLTGIVWQI